MVRYCSPLAPPGQSQIVAETAPLVRQIMFLPLYFYRIDAENSGDYLRKTKTAWCSASLELSYCSCDATLGSTGAPGSRDGRFRIESVAA
jgi:hypothetical protein